MSESIPSPAATSGIRRQRTLAEARELVALWRASGQTQKDFCHSQGILRSALQSCRLRTGDMARPKPVQRKAAGDGFVQVMGAGCPSPVETESGLKITTADGPGLTAYVLGSGATHEFIVGGTVV